MGDALGVSKNYVWMIEKGSKEPSKKVLAKLDLLENSEIDAPQTTPADLVAGDKPVSYSMRRELWMEAADEKLAALLHEYAEEKDWGAVKEITTELLNRKISAKLKGNRS